MSVSTATQVKNDVNFRYGQDFTFDNIKYAWRRQGYANRIVVQTVDAAIRGFDIVDKKTQKPIKKNDEAWEVISSMWSDLKKSIYYERAYGKSVGVFWLIEDQEFPFWRTYDLRNYFAFYDKFGVPTKYQVSNRVGGMNAVFSTSDIIDDELNAAYEIIIREDEVKGEGLSILEPVWDTIFALSSLDEQGTYYAIRYGAGIRYLKVSKKDFENASYMAGLFKLLRGGVGANGVFVLPYLESANGKREETEVSSETPVQLDFIQLRDLLIGTLSVQTGIPREVLLGSQIGLRSSEKNEDAYFDYLQAIQIAYRPFFRWIVLKLNELYDWFSENTMIDIVYYTRETMDQGEKMTLLAQQLDIVSKAGYKVKQQWLQDQISIPLEEKEIDPLGINKGKKEGDKEDEDDKEEKTEETDSNNKDQDDDSQTPDEDEDEEEE